MNNKYKKSSRSRSRQKQKSPYHHKDKNKYKIDRDKDREYKQRQKQKQKKDKDKYKEKQRQRNKDRSRQHSPKNRKKYHSSSQSQSSSSSSSNSSNNSNSQQQYKKNKRYNQSLNINLNTNTNVSQQPKYKIQQTKTLKIQNCPYLQQAQRVLIDASISVGTSVPDQVQLKQNSIYIKYPSIQVSTLIKQKLKEIIKINNQQYRINYYPFKRIDLTASYDWYCNKCDYKNFARRNKCYRCQNQKNQLCKLNYSSTPTPQVNNNNSNKNNKQDNINNCSLMIRGSIITDTQQQIILDIFESMCSVKDIRMIKNKMTGQMKDFVFIQFFTPQDASYAYKQATSSQFRIRGQKVSVMYSRNKSQDDYIKPLPYQKRQRDRDRKKDKKNEQIQSYYNRQRQLQIQQQKQRPLITIQQLKQKHQQQLRKKAANVRQLTQQQIKRRQAEIMAKQMQKQAKIQNTIMYICVPCRRKFKGQADMKIHQQSSEFHKFNKQKMELSI